MIAVMDAPKQHNEEVFAEETLIRRIERTLQQSGYPELQNLEIIQGHDRILLYGRVRTYFLKQLAQSLILALPDVTAVENQMDVD